MYKYVIKPLVIIFLVYLIPALGTASDIAQLTNLNLLNLITSHSPQSYFLIVFLTLIIYLYVVFFTQNTKNSDKRHQASGKKADQIISTRNVKDSTIIQINKDKGE